MELTKKQETTMGAAKKGYEAYSRYTGGRSAVTGDKLPEWRDLPGSIANAWFAAADAIIREVVHESSDDSQNPRNDRFLTGSNPVPPTKID